jgi:hypothetical protein
MISISDENKGRIDVIKKACDRYSLSFSELAVRGVIREFESGGWSDLVKKQEDLK